MGNFDDLLKLLFGNDARQTLAAPVITCSENVVTMTGTGIIYYTADGTTPTTSSAVYTSPILINANTTFKAFCVAPGMADSQIVTYNAVFSNSSKPFYIENTSGNSGTVTFKKGGTIGRDAPSIDVYTSSNNVNWAKSGTTSTSGFSVSIPANGRLYVRATADRWATSSANYNNISVNVNCTLNGNILSLLYGEDFRNYTVLKSYDETFTYIFNGNTKIISADSLVLPSNTTEYCYCGMFSNCSSLTATPVLPATTLATRCYINMFRGCTSLVNAPELPATTLGDGCYNGMFQGCTSLVNAPLLSATNLGDGCYNGMFYNCTSLVVPPSLPATTLAEYCYQEMFYGCISLETAPSLPATAMLNGCYKRMFYGCTSLVTAPELPATTLVPHNQENGSYQCYYEMFRGCSSLNYIKAMLTTTPSDFFTGNWVNGVSATGTFVKNASATWDVTGTNGVPSGWTIQTV